MTTGASAQVPRQLTVSSVNLRSWVVWPGSIPKLALDGLQHLLAPRTWQAVPMHTRIDGACPAA